VPGACPVPGSGARGVAVHWVAVRRLATAAPNWPAAWDRICRAPPGPAMPSGPGETGRAAPGAVSAAGVAVAAGAVVAAGAAVFRESRLRGPPFPASPFRGSTFRGSCRAGPRTRPAAGRAPSDRSTKPSACSGGSGGGACPGPSAGDRMRRENGRCREPQKRRPRAPGKRRYPCRRGTGPSRAQRRNRRCAEAG
jgi:hypothetical protein